MASSARENRFDEEPEHDIPAAAEGYDLNISSATRVSGRQMVSTCSIPLATAADELNDESADAIAEGDAFLASGKPGRFSDAHSLIESAME